MDAQTRSSMSFSASGGLCFLTHKMDIPGCWVISRVILSGMTNALILRHYHAQQICREKEWKVPKQIQVEQLLWIQRCIASSWRDWCLVGYRKRPYHCGMKRIGFMMEPVRQNVSAILQSSLAMKYVKYIVYPFAKQKALSIPCFRSWIYRLSALTLAVWASDLVSWESRFHYPRLFFNFFKTKNNFISMD